MANLPTKANLTSGTTTEAQFQAAIGGLYDFIAQLVVGAAVESLVISSDKITPTTTNIVIDTEGSLPTDNLTNILATNVGAKTIFLRIASSSRAVTIKHNSTGSGKIILSGGADLLLDHSSCMVSLCYDVDSQTWTEQWRNFGIHAPTPASKLSARASMGLGTASTVDTGSASNQIPLNSDLGQLASLNIDDISSIAGATGDFIPSLAASRSGCVLADGRSIGSATSTATNRANADTRALYNLLWSLNSTSFPLRNGGIIQSRGASASADWNNGYTIDLPDLRGRALVGRDNMGGTAANRITTALSGVNGTILGATGGLEAVVLTSGQLAAHFHSAGDMGAISGGEHSHTGLETSTSTPHTGPHSTLVTSIGAYNASGNTDRVNLGNLVSGGGHSHTITGNTALSGSNEAHQNLQPSLVGNIFIRL